jgi:CspA family cold shock protein
MGTGTLKKWDRARGFGFIADDSKGPDVFVHATVLKSAHIDVERIEDGTRLSFEKSAQVPNRATRVGLVP